MSRTLPSQAALDRAADLAVATMRDRCVLRVRSITQDAATGMPIEAWADGVETVCGFVMTIRPEGGVQGTTRREGEGSTQVLITVTSLRLPLALAEVDTLARVRLTHRRGVALATPETYDLTSAIRGALQWNCDLQRVAHTREGDG